MVVGPLPPKPPRGLAAAPEIAIAVASGNRPFITCSVLRQPLTLDPQCPGASTKLSPPRLRGTGSGCQGVITLALMSG